MWKNTYVWIAYLPLTVIFCVMIVSLLLLLWRTSLACSCDTAYIHWTSQSVRIVSYIMRNIVFRMFLWRPIELFGYTLFHINISAHSSYNTSGNVFEHVFQLVHSYVLFKISILILGKCCFFITVKKQLCEYYLWKNQNISHNCCVTQVSTKHVSWGKKVETLHFTNNRLIIISALLYHFSFMSPSASHMV